MALTPKPKPAHSTGLEQLIEWMILGSRWLLAPLYLALSSLLIIFAVKAGQEVLHLFGMVLEASEAQVVLSILSLIDLVLIANLLVMVVMSSYETFVSRLDPAVDVERPDWLGKLDASTIKLKLAVSVVAVSSIHLLKVFINLEKYDHAQLLWFVVIHLAFVISALLLAWIDKIAFRHH